jgi:Carboxypeptidase regulatory-like domain/TonB dependent receptor-like, beta-barrel
MASRILHILCGLLLLLTAVTAEAAVTGSISGVVRSADGSVLPGVTVTVSGEALPGGRSAVSGPDGVFNFQRLPPGTYKVAAELSGMGGVQQEAIVAVDKDTQLDLVLKPSMAEAITVSAAAPVIDVKSPEVQINYTAETIEKLPIARDYKGLFQLAPGVSENNRGTAPNAGGSRLDNTFLVDGINITNPHYGDILPDINEIDIDEVNIKRAGVSAEFGRTGGMVVNAVTKSGTNDFHGLARIESQPASFVADSKHATVQNSVDRQVPAGSLGGPLAHDRLWFYGSLAFPKVTTTDRVNNLGAVPDKVDDTKEYFLKLTANPTQSQSLTAAGRTRDTTFNKDGIGASTHPSAGSNNATDYTIGTVTWTWLLTADSFVEAKYNHDKEENSTDPLTHLGYRPTFNPARPDQMGAFTSTPDFLVGGATAPGQTVGGASLAINNQDFTRDEARATYQMFRSWLGGSHDIRAGVTYGKDSERLERRANGWGTVTWNATTRLFTASYVSQQPPHTGRGESYGVFLQDQFSAGDRTTITAGVLVNKDNYFGEALGAAPGTKRKVKILTFDWGQEIQPRLGITFVPHRELGDKLYASAGRYYNTDNKSLVRAASPTRIFTTTATFDAAGNLLRDVPAANTQSKTIDPGLDPQYTDELAAGYARPLGRAWSAELWGMVRNVGNIMEDISADGLGHGPFHVAQLPDAYRRYKAVTLEFTRIPVNDRFKRLAVNASYTWSRLSGNWDIDFGGDSPFLNSSFIGDGPGVLITDNRDGILRGDRTHVVKLFATFQPLEHLRAGTYVRYQSGGAWEARGLPDPTVSSSSYIRYLEPAGTRRMPSWTNVDLVSGYTFNFGRIGLELEGRILNVFDEQVETAVDDRLVLGRPVPYVPNNPAFGTGTVFTPPRSYVLTAIVRY